LFPEISEPAIRQLLNQRLRGLFVDLLQMIATVFDRVDEQKLPEAFPGMTGQMDSWPGLRTIPDKMMKPQNENGKPNKNNTL
jgi:hypothetical protein